MNRLALLGASALLICAGCTDDGGAGEEPIMLDGGITADTGPTPDTGADPDAGPTPDTGADPDEGPDPDLGPPPECGDENTAEQPPPLNEHVAAYDPGADLMVIFGGNTAVPENCGFPAYTFLDTTWIYDVAAAETGCNPWRIHDGAGPRGRTRHAATWGDGAMWVYGGRFRPGMSGNYTVLGDLWRFDPATGWTEHTAPGPAPRYNTSIIYDAARARLILYAGNGASSGAAPLVLGDLWAFDLATGDWTELETMGPGPSGRMWHAALYDAARDRMVVHGGGDETAFANDATYFDEIWALDLETLTWSQPHAGGAQAPDGRFWGSLVYDDMGDRYVMFAGHDDTNLGNRNDLAAYDPTEDRWRSQSMGDRYNAPPNGFCDFPADFTVIEPGTPERRNAHSAVWAGDQMIVFGGKSDCGAVNDVWHYDDANGWTNPVMATEGEMCIRFRANPDNCVNMCF